VTEFAPLIQHGLTGFTFLEFSNCSVFAFCTLPMPVCFRGWVVLGKGFEIYAYWTYILSCRSNWKYSRRTRNRSRRRSEGLNGTGLPSNNKFALVDNYSNGCSLCTPYKSIGPISLSVSLMGGSHMRTHAWEAVPDRKSS
jgi:hypothetical protein